MADVKLAVSGMSCEHCASAVARALQQTRGVVSASVDLKTGIADVCYDATATDVAALIKAVDEHGYKTELTDGEKFKAPPGS